MKVNKTTVKMLAAVYILSATLTSCGFETKDAASDGAYGAIAECVANTLNTSEAEKERTVINYNYVKAIWISQFDMAAVLRQSEAGYIASVKKIVANLKSDGINTVIFQIRPYGDSFYDSAYYPTSRFVSGCDYDAVGIFINECHENALSVHAWINPYRLETEDNIDIASYFGLELCKWEGRYYFDPADENAKRLICEGAREALMKYEFDGLHMDDYFYPTSDPAFDEKSFSVSGESDLRSFRENSVNDLVRRLYEVVKAVDNRLLYGISPAGNLSSVRRVYYADVEKWCSGSGYIDYIMPQVYFGFLHGSCPFDKTVDAWGGIIKNPDVKLIIGMTLSKACSESIDNYAGTEEGKHEWLNNKDVIARSLRYVYASKFCSGISLFCYQYLYDPVSGNENPLISCEKSRFSELLK